MPSQLNLCLFLFIALNLQSKMELNTTATKRGSPEAAPVASLRTKILVIHVTSTQLHA
jgi:hypothetical protein